MEIGGERSKFAFKASNDDSKASHEKIFVYAYPIQSDDKPISLVMNIVAQSPFRSAEMNLDQYRKLVKESKVFFSRSVKVVPKGNIKTVAFESPDNNENAPNKIELFMVIEGR